MSLAGHGQLTLHQIVCECRHVSCAKCQAPEDQPCACCPGGVHYARLSRACAAGYIGLADFADAIHDDVFSGGDVFAPDGAA